nr:uncharacterized protein LOC106838708 [Equus asinus]
MVFAFGWNLDATVRKDGRHRVETRDALKDLYTVPRKRKRFRSDSLNRYCHFLSWSIRFEIGVSDLEVTGLWGAESHTQFAKTLLCKNYNTNVLIYEKYNNEGARIVEFAGPDLLCVDQITMKATSKLF